MIHITTKTNDLLLHWDMPSTYKIPYEFLANLPSWQKIS